MPQSPNTFFGIDLGKLKSTMASLSAGQRSAFQLLMFGGVFPSFVLSMGLPVSGQPWHLDAGTRNMRGR